MSEALDGWKFMMRIVEAARASGIELEKVLKFMALLTLADECEKPGNVEGPTKPQ